MIVDLSRSSFLSRLESARRGTWIMYHVGFIYEERRKDRKLTSLANEAYSQYELGKVCLVQRKLGTAMYEYYAVKR